MLDHRLHAAKVFQALADPTRLAIVDRLAKGGASVSELAEPFDITLAAVVQHVQALEAAGLIVTKKSGRTRRCTINLDALRAAESWIAERRRFWERQFDALAVVVEEDV
ncbi:MAG TPA: metalloregulator ArsR/SmtB family transcription factor [bacterium]